MKVLLLIAVASVAMAKPQYGYSPPHTYRPAPTYAPAPSYRPAPSYQAPSKYDYEWGVRDSFSANDFGHNEDRDGYNTRGSYYVQLPDGRRQKVTYYVNGDSGYVAEVTYEDVVMHQLAASEHAVVDAIAYVAGSGGWIYKSRDVRAEHDSHPVDVTHYEGRSLT
ncbi:cuticle protein 7-like [Penaeus japonicus]|uniref:cuticle protein 7-like n=1 Tax=Penaeus japonicus TaxID=27405 RepID=UPI001C716802|nr:cuticle protein 7-like [Penaeus japonicus]